MAITTHQMEKIFEEGHCLVDLLPYIEYGNCIFILADGSLGRVWKIGLYETEGREQDYFLSLSGHLENLLNRIPTQKLACQVILTSHRQIHDQLSAYEDFHEGHHALSIFARGKINHIEASRDGFFDSKTNGFTPKKIEAYLTLRFFPDWVYPSFWQKTMNVIQAKETSQERIFKQSSHYQQEFKKYSGLVEGVLQAAGINYQILDEKKLMGWVYEILNPKRCRMIPAITINQNTVLRDQVLYNFPLATPYGFVLEDHHMRVVSLKELPSETSSGMFSRELYEGTRFCLLDIPSDLMVVVNFTVPPLQTAMDHLHMQKSFAFMHQDNWLGDKSVEAFEKKKELDETLSDLFKSGQKIVHARMHFVVRHQRQEKAEEDASHLINILNRLNCEGIKEELIGAALFLTCLPLNFDLYYEKFIRRAKRLMASNAADMLPLYGSLKGTKTPAQLYLNRRGEIIFLDFFDSNINPHGVVIGASGAGKSFFMNDFILQNDRLGAHFFVLDKGDSYKKLSAILDGQYISFDLNCPVRINPFINEPTPENLSFLMSLLSQMASGGDERDRLNREEEGLLQKAVLKAYEQRQAGGEITLSEVVFILNDNQFNEIFGINSLMGPTLALRLTPFTRRGPYGGFFDGVNEFKIKDRFTVFELANLSAYPDLQLAVLLNLMFFMTAFVSLADMKPKRKYLLIDEAWSLLKVKNTADFITNAFKTFRKYRCSVVAITQELADLTRHETGLAIVANASNKIFLKQEASLIDLLKDRLSLPAGILGALKTVETVKGKYSEAFVITDSCSGIIRLIPDPFLYWAANSEPRNNEYLWAKACECQGNLTEAINLCAKEYPYGLL
ncbi:MAG: TraC family protein [Candidatus Omnitrophica bacterium]|nr:TraC family protein [Candidatus Omnitrophota bacterium]